MNQERAELQAILDMKFDLEEPLQALQDDDDMLTQEITLQL